MTRASGLSNDLVVLQLLGLRHTIGIGEACQRFVQGKVRVLFRTKAQHWIATVGRTQRELSKREISKSIDKPLALPL